MRGDAARACRNALAGPGRPDAVGLEAVALLARLQRQEAVGHPIELEAVSYTHLRAHETSAHL
eukprot:4653620-Alexandrium_andersonii.AAC.1